MSRYFPEIMVNEFCAHNTHTRPALFKTMFSRTYFLSISLKIGTPKFRRRIMDLLPWKSLHEIRDIVDVLHNTTIEIFEAKKKALEEGDDAVAQQIGQGKDIMSILSAYCHLLGHECI